MEIKIKKLEVGQMKANCYLIIDRKSENCLIIDPGDDADYIKRIISDEDVRPVGIVATHGHFDHVLSVLDLKMSYEIPFAMGEKDKFLLDRADKASRYFTGTSDQLPAPSIDILLGGETKLSNFSFDAIPVPGHTPGSYCLRFDDSIFVGDIVFADGSLGRTDFKYSDKNLLIQSIKKLLAFDEDTMLYPGHGESFTIAEFRHIFGI